MKVKWLGSDRSAVLRVLEAELGERAVYCPSPEFAYVVGHCRLQRDGTIVAEEGDAAVLAALAALGLCDLPCAPQPPDEGTIAYPMAGCTSLALMNLMGIVSARQRLLNQAIDARGAFYVSEALMKDLLAHPPQTLPAFLQALYGRDGEYGGVAFSRDWIRFTGFTKGRAEEAPLHRQLAERMMEAARTKRWVKPFTENARNRKYAFRTWLNAIGMIGPEYEAARGVFLGRLYGRSDQRAMPRGKERA